MAISVYDSPIGRSLYLLSTLLAILLMLLSVRTGCLLLFTSSAMWISGCGKSSDPTPRTRTELLTGAKWRLTESVVVTTLNGASTTVDEMPSRPACEKDDFMTFSTSPRFIVTYDNGPLKCNPSSDQTFDGGWKFGTNEASLIFNPQSSTTFESPIESLTAKKLVLLDEGYVQVGNASAAYKRTITYTAL